MGWLGFSGRCNKQQYWAMVVVLLAAPALANMAHLPVAGTEALWLVLYGRRLHDFGKTRWWAVGVILLSLLPAILFGALDGESFRNVILHQGVDESGHRSLAYIGAIGGAFLIQHGFTVWLGLQKSDEGQNRFGPPQKSWGSTGQRPKSAEPSIWEARLWEDEEPRAPTMTPAPPRAPPAAAQYATHDTRPVFGRRPSL